MENDFAPTLSRKAVSRNGEATPECRHTWQSMLQRCYCRGQQHPGASNGNSWSRTWATRLGWQSDQWKDRQSDQVAFARRLKDLKSDGKWSARSIAFRKFHDWSDAALQDAAERELTLEPTTSEPLLAKTIAVRIGLEKGW